MVRTVAIGVQGFSELREHGYFYIDKTSFIRDWWNGGDKVTLISRPRRFGKTLTLDMVRCFFSAVVVTLSRPAALFHQMQRMHVYGQKDTSDLCLFPARNL